MIDRYEISISQIAIDIFLFMWIFHPLSLTKLVVRKIRAFMGSLFYHEKN
jgi:hypothetical protein